MSRNEGGRKRRSRLPTSGASRRSRQRRALDTVQLPRPKVQPMSHGELFHLLERIDTDVALPVGRVDVQLPELIAVG